MKLSDFVSSQAEVKVLQEREADLKKEMASLKERNHSLEQMLSDLTTKGAVHLILFILRDEPQLRTYVE